MEKYNTSEERIWALLIDGVLLFLLNLLQNQVLSYADSNISANLILLFFSFLTLVYLILPIYLYGQTFGKWCLKITVVDISEAKKLTFWQAILRNPIITISFLLHFPLWINLMFFNEANPYIKSLSEVINENSFLWFIAELITFWSNSKKRALHDYIAGTVVVKNDYLTNLPIEKIA